MNIICFRLTNMVNFYLTIPVLTKSSSVAKVDGQPVQKSLLNRVHLQQKVKRLFVSSKTCYGFSGVSKCLKQKL